MIVNQQYAAILYRIRYVRCRTLLEQKYRDEMAQAFAEQGSSSV